MLVSTMDVGTMTSEPITVVRGQAIPQPQAMQTESLPPFINLPFDAPAASAEDPFKTEDGGDLPF